MSPTTIKTKKTSRKVKPVEKKSVATVSAKIKSTRLKKPSAHVKSDTANLTIAVTSAKEGKASQMTLPSELFDAPVTQQLMAQAVRVYLANQRQGSASTKTRGEVEGSTRKIYRQKGTGRARHGGIRAPIFVGGGIVFGPTPRDFSLTMPKTMKKKALASALTVQYRNNNISVIDGMETLPAKTKRMAQALRMVSSDEDDILLVVPPQSPNIVRCCRNIPSVEIISAANINTYMVLAHKKIVFMKKTINIVKDYITGEKTP